MGGWINTYPTGRTEKFRYILYQHGKAVLPYPWLECQRSKWGVRTLPGDYRSRTVYPGLESGGRVLSEAEPPSETADMQWGSCMGGVQYPKGFCRKPRAMMFE
eukprot:767704-Hanusia_phi.AAC.7